MQLIGKTNSRAVGGSINGIVDAYTVFSGETISAKDFVQFVSQLESETTLSTSTVNGCAAVALDASRVLVLTYNSAAVVTISGGTLSIGSFTSTGLSLTTNGCSPRAVLMSANTVLAIGYMSYSGSNRIVGVVLTVSGTTVTAGTLTATVTTSASSNDQYAICRLSETEAFICYAYGAYYQLYGVLAKLSGSSITAGTGTRLLSNNYRGTTLSAAALSSGTVVIAHSTSISSNSPTTARLGGLVVTISGGTITAGTSTVLNSTSGTGYSPCAVGISAGRAFVAAGTQGVTTLGYDLSISGTSVSVRDTTLMGAAASPYKQGSNVQTAYMGNNVVAGVYRATSTYTPILGKTDLSVGDASNRAQQDATQSGITLSNYISVTPLTATTAFVLSGESSTLKGYILNLRAAVRAMPDSVDERTVISGVADESGNGGDSIDVVIPNI